MQRRNAQTREFILRLAIEKGGGIEAFLNQGFLQIPYDPSFLAENIPSITEGMRRMIDTNDRACFLADIIKTDEVGWKIDSGLYRRSEREQKWFFHCFKETRDRMKERDAPVEMYNDFFMALQDLNWWALEIARTTCAIIDECQGTEIPPSPSQLQPAFQRGYAVTRCLRYLEREAGKPDAAAHYDRSGMTVHWWGSRQGLIVVDRKGVKHRILETEYDSICIFPGKKFGGLTDYRYGNGTLHGVVDTARESGAEGDRLALVTFVHPQLTEAQAKLVRERDPECSQIEANFVL